MQVDTLFHGASLATMIGAGTGARTDAGTDAVTDAGLGTVPDGVVAVQAGRIVHAGPRAAAPALTATRSIDCEGRWITPGLIDCHTHLLFGGNRAAEFEARLAGAAYADLAAIGGIRTTVAATRAADDETLLAGGLARLDRMLARGVTTVEVKSGYGLDTHHELRLLRLARTLGDRRAVRVRTSLLAAHALPPGQTDADAYIDRIIAETLPAALAERLADAMDGFCETIAFSALQIDRLFTAATAAGLRVKLHADQLTDGGGAALAARHHALSADHLEYTDPAAAPAMAQAGTVAVLLPGAFYALRETRHPPVDAFRAAGVKIAVATDCNPGSSPLTSPLLAMNMAATLFGLTVTECLRGMTVHAAAALGLADVGTLAPGQAADLAIWSVGTPAELVYWMDADPLWRRIVAGNIA